MDIIKKLDPILTQLGIEPTDELQFMLISFSVLIGFVSMLILHFSLRKRVKTLLRDAEGYSSGLRGRVEKVEREVNEIKTNIQREKIQEQNIEQEIQDPVEPEVEQEAEEQVKEEIPTEPEPLKKRLESSRAGLFGKIKNIFDTKPKIEADDLEEIEELLVSADLGVKTSLELIEEARQELESGKDLSQEALLSQIQNRVKEILLTDQSPIEPEKSEHKPYVVLVIGVNGVGKTTSVAKLAKQWSDAGLKITMAAADTFRAAAVEQLCTWGERLNVPVVTGAPEAKPATVVFDALDQATENSSDVLLVDTAGRLHNKANLMQELEGISNIINKKLGRAADQVLLVVDGATGQNALSQAKEFNDIAPLTGLIVTKLDGTPKGGIVVAIKSELDIPIRYIGVGEAASDLREFNSEEFVEALF